jgi:quercetin dioxygenase-like cupin family protein
MIRISSLAGLLLGACAISAHAADAADNAHAVLLKSPAQAQFVASPGVPACTRSKLLRGDPGKGPSSILVKMDGGCVVPWHWHSASEELLILSGTVIGQMRGESSFQLGAKGYVGMPAHHVHRFKCAMGASCTVFVVLDAAFDLHFVDASDQLVTLEQALAADRESKGEGW